MDAPRRPAAPSRIVLIGRARGNDIVLKSPGVSARHARVIVEPGRLVLEDLGSRNGTFVGSPPERIERAEISLADPLTFGNTLLPPSALADLLARTWPRTPAAAIELGGSAVVTIGRGAQASLPIDCPIASALHASIAVEAGRVVVRDLGSMTGTFVDGRRIDGPVALEPGHVVQVADQRYRLAPDALSLEPLEAHGDAIETVAAAVAVAGGKRILEDVSLVIEPGELVAVMGPSGSGKSTLLALVNGQAMPAAGRVLVGGLDLQDHYELFRGRIAFVPQDDILHADLTVWQALWYAARLRLPSDTTAAEIDARLRRVIAQLGLEGSEQTRVGDQRKRGVSGGQRKRVNLAMELITDPPILVLDEPTSGLSSTDALAVIELLRTLADQGKTIIVTIHQPSIDAFRLFDAVAVIARDASTRQVGRLAYFGRAWPDAVTFFEPAAAGPPVTVDGLLRGLATRPVAEWASRWDGSAAKSIWVEGRSSGQGPGAGRRRRPAARPVARLRQWATLVARSLAVKAADRWNTAVLLLQAPLVAALIAVVFARVLRTEPTLATWPRAGADMATAMFVTALAAIWFGISGTAREIVTEWPIYRRERMVGLSIASYLGSKLAVLAAVAAIQTAVLTAIVAPGCGLRGPWGEAWLVLFLAALAGGALGLAISASLRTAEAAAAVLPILLLPMIVLGGILVPLADLPAATRPLAAMMPSRWAFEGLVVPEALARPRVSRIPPAEPAAADTTAAPGPSRLPVVAVAGGSRRFILPGRRRIAEAVEDAAARAEAEMQRAKREAEEKAAAMQRQTEAEFERRSEVIRRQTEQEIESRAAGMRRETEAGIEKALEASQADFEKRARELNAGVEERIAERIREANEKLEDRLKTMQEAMEAERARMAEMLERAGAAAVIVPAERAGAPADSQASEPPAIDMAERFFPRAAGRSPPGVPLGVLAGMAALGVAATAVLLVRRDASGR